ncbi:MAG: hypothetical protein CVU07_07250, partial [Bacteroidetes bacterium HGW-Bacteroidetes-23]
KKSEAFKIRHNPPNPWQNPKKRSFLKIRAIRVIRDNQKKERSVTKHQKLSAFPLCGKQKKAKRKNSCNSLISGKQKAKLKKFVHSWQPKKRAKRYPAPKA